LWVRVDSLASELGRGWLRRIAHSAWGIEILITLCALRYAHRTNTGGMIMAKIDKKQLEGLTFSGATAKKDEKTGKKVWKPFTRPLTEDDILSSSEDGTVITTKDGKKYDLSKINTKKQDDKKPEDKKPDDKK